MKIIRFAPCILLFLLVILNRASLVGAVPPLNLAVSTDKLAYMPEESVRISGTLSLGTDPLVEWIITISINTPSGTNLFHTTVETDQAGAFITIFNLPPETELGTYTLVSSVYGADQYVTKEITFEIKSTNQVENVQPILQLPSSLSPIPLTLIAICLAFGLIISTLVVSGLAMSRKKEQTPMISAPPITLDTTERSVRKLEIPKTPITPVKLATPTTRGAPLVSATPVGNMAMTSHKTCVECRRTFLGIRTFCPYCFTYHGRDNYGEKITV